MQVARTLVTTMALVAITAVPEAFGQDASSPVKLPDGATRALVGAGTLNVGSSVAAAGDFNGDGRPDWIVGGFADTGAMRAYIVYGSLEPGTTVAETDRLKGQSAGFTIRRGGGYTVSPAGDFNGDGVDDVAVESQAKTASGFVDNVTVVLGRKGESGLGIDLSATEPGRTIPINGIDPGSVAGAGDMNGDGLADIVIGNRFQTAAGVKGGVAAVVYGRASTAAVNVYKPSDGAVLLAGKNGPPQGSPDGLGDELGASVDAAGDVDGDGLADLVVGAPGVGRNGGSRPGAAFVVYGSRTPQSQVLDAQALSPERGFAITSAPGSSGALGSAVAGLGDLTGDGRPDLAVGAPTTDGQRGRVWVVRGGRMSGSVSVADPAAIAMSIAPGAAAAGTGYESFGQALAGVGDVNRDGRGDLAVAGLAGPKRVHVVYGRDGGEARFAERNLTDGTGFTIETPDGTKNDRFGDSIAGVGGSVLVGARSLSPQPGAAFLVAGAAPPTASPAPLRFTSLGLQRRSFRPGNAATSFLFKLSAPARVSFTIYRLSGRSRCQRTVAPLAPRPCLPEVARVGRLNFPQRAAKRQKLNFSGRLGAKKLAPGRYIAQVQATDGKRYTLGRPLPFEVLAE